MSGDNINTPELRAQVEQLREKLARMEALLKRKDAEAWTQYQRERAEAIRHAERVSNTIKLGTDDRS